MITRKERMVFDIGMYDGEDTAYYLQQGYRVVSVEANPDFVLSANRRFANEIATERLFVENKAIGETQGYLTLYLCGEDSGSNSLIKTRIEQRDPTGEITVEAIPICNLFTKYGVPDFMKVDIEGADRFCILPLTTEMRPNFVSFEMGEDAEELLTHLQTIGYTKFKIISQLTFRELNNVNCFTDRLGRRLRRIFGISEPEFIRRGDRLFKSGHSSGPIPEFTDGRWFSPHDTIERWRDYVQTPRFWGWFDLIAAIG